MRPGFVIGRVALLFVGNDQRFALHAHHDLVFGQLKIELSYHLAILARRNQRGFVHQVGKIGARKTGRSACNHAQIHIVGQRSLLGMDAQDHLTTPDVGTANNYAPVETARAQQRRIQNIGTIGRRHQDHAFVGFKSVHLHQQLIQRLLALVVPAA
jgi:hypothetical protein